MILVLDVETTGLVVKDLPLNNPAQPRIAQLGFVLQDYERRVRGRYEALIKPDGWEIAKEAAAINGLSTSDCARWGVEPIVAMATLFEAAKCARVLCAHNLEFDAKMIRRELLLLDEARQRAGHKGIAEAGENMGLARTRFRRMCTQKLSQAFFPDAKSVSLSLLYRTLTGNEYQDAHSALADCEATAECFWGYVDRRMIEL